MLPLFSEYRHSSAIAPIAVSRSHTSAHMRADTHTHTLSYTLLLIAPGLMGAPKSGCFDQA